MINTMHVLEDVIWAVNCPISLETWLFVQMSIQPNNNEATNSLY